MKGNWWEIYQEPELNALEEKLNISNQNIAQSFQNFMAARAQVRQARAAYYPTVSVGPAYTRGPYVWQYVCDFPWYQSEQ